jgi:hypothetical protein
MSRSEEKIVAIGDLNKNQKNRSLDFIFNLVLTTCLNNNFYQLELIMTTIPRLLFEVDNTAAV